MRDKEDYKQQSDNVLPMEKWRQEKTTVSGDSVSLLLEHMRMVRQSVPVNDRLKEELRQKMFPKAAESQSVEPGPENIKEQQSESKTGFRKKLKWYGIPAILAILLCIIWFGQAGGYSKLETVGDLQEVARYWSDKEDLQPAVSPDGKKLLLTRSGLLLMLDQDGTQRVLLQPQINEKYTYPSWTSDGNKITLVKKINGQNEEIIQLAATALNSGVSQGSHSEWKNNLESFSRQKPELLYRGKAGEEISNLHWSPVGNNLAFIVRKENQDSVIILDQEKKIHNRGEGSELTWSPDGSALVVERKKDTSQLLIIGPDGQEVTLTKGENPVWGQQGYLVYTDMKSQERILTYMPDGEPQFTVEQKVGEIRSLYLGKNGIVSLKKVQEKKLAEQSNLLININNQGSLTELKWLRDLAENGVKDPRVLMLDDIEKNISQCFGPQGKTLYLTRTEGETVSIMRADLRESL
ncbi:hypothetical protein Dtox_1779 [Desulfofarcimen acetoxidans DSM 771]|uniref:WD40 domain protein beta Propeller n=1 Tax=Desulfofarcimen acetoxidans (strain ATCC 49208 / DSM 771 / KCTC 5769 / VKM B-1644 / 5575) TaxID=485916 RepID=C8VX56_DESAS|nr:hypothetical protein [Desulfofarcimen acetoxidans]ACV62632.1 hypothetical protein Dtox_1779 [Desulfofarcimen acetoxidans DSM 771]